MKRMVAALACVMCLLLLAAAANSSFMVFAARAEEAFAALPEAEKPESEDAGAPEGPDAEDALSPDRPEADETASAPENPAEQYAQQDEPAEEPVRALAPRGRIVSATGKFSLEMGAELPLAVTGDGLEGLSLTWRSSNPKVAFVSDGSVIGVSEGRAEITAEGTTESGAQFSAECELTVLAASALSVSVPSQELAVGDSMELTTQLKGSQIADLTVRWTSSEPSVALVEGGYVYGLTPGSAVITAVCEYTQAGAPRRASYNCPVQVYGLRLFGMDGQPLQMGESRTFFAEMVGHSAALAMFTWSSSNTQVARVNQGGVVEGVSPGTATIKVICDYSVNGRLRTMTASERVTVSGPQPVRFSLAPEQGGSTILPGETLRLLVRSSGDDLEGYSISWSSLDREVAQVDAAGRVTGVAPGAAIITASVEYVTRSGIGSTTLSFEVIVQ